MCPHVGILLMGPLTRSSRRNVTRRCRQLLGEVNAAPSLSTALPGGQRWQEAPASGLQPPRLGGGGAPTQAGCLLSAETLVVVGSCGYVKALSVLKSSGSPPGLCYSSVAAPTIPPPPLQCGASWPTDRLVFLRSGFPPPGPAGSCDAACDGRCFAL